MTEEPLPSPDDAPPADPFEAELVAYLDGELDQVAARKIEVRLATDPAARAKAAALKKTFDLLDYLPRPEPTPTFATRTLDKLPALKSGSLPVPIPSVAAQPPGHPSNSSPASVISSSAPVALATGSMGLHPVALPRRWVVAASIVFAVVGLGAIGYLGAAALRPHLFPAPSQRDSGPDDLPLSDHRLIENLPLYAVADDLEFVQKLAEPEYFGEDSATSIENSKDPGVDLDKPSTAAFESLAKAFKELPAARQQDIRELDKQIHAQDASTRERLFRVLEAYAVWLHRLPEPERKGVLAAGTPGLRLGVIRDLRERQWLDALPAGQRNQLTGMSIAKKAEIILQWKDEEARRRDLWAFVRKNAEAIRDNKAPWPFDTETRRKEVIEFVRTALRPDDAKRSRLNLADQDRYREALNAAEKNGAWAWYGKAVYDLARKHEMLPEPADAKFLYLDFNDLPPTLNKAVERPTLKRKLAPLVGKWPDFPLALQDELRALPGKFGPMPPLGPARVSEFKEPVRTFWEKELSPKLTPPERGLLRALENRWPEYPREFVRLARTRDLSVPGAMLPGSPQRWDATYGGPFRPMGKP